jgi:hypothetical protein
MKGVPTCREVTNLVASGELESSSLRKRLKVRLHLFMCKHCSGYLRQIRASGERTRSVLGGGGEETSVADRLEETILKGIRAGDPGEPERTA